MAVNKGLFTSDTAEWETPQDFFDELDQEFSFDFDPCATIENAKCAQFYTKENDGLSLPWYGTVFMNPPYGREIGKWVARAADEGKKGATVVCLLPARTDTRWYHEHIWDAKNHRPREGVQVRLIRGRLKFGGASNSAPFPSMVVIFGHKEGDNRD